MIEQMGKFQAVLEELPTTLKLFKEIYDQRYERTSWNLCLAEINNRQIFFLKRFGYKIDKMTAYWHGREVVSWSLYTPTYPIFPKKDQVFGPDRHKQLVRRKETRIALKDAVEATQKYCHLHNILAKISSYFNWKTEQFILNIMFDNEADSKKIGVCFPIYGKTFPINKVFQSKKELMTHDQLRYQVAREAAAKGFIKTVNSPQTIVV